MPETLTPPEQEHENQNEEFELPEGVAKEITLDDFTKKLDESRENLKKLDSKEKEKNTVDFFLLNYYSLVNKIQYACISIFFN